MNDNEIIKALECCVSPGCENCPYDGDDLLRPCNHNLMKDALDLITRQKAEIERLKKFLDMSRKVSLARRDQNIRKDELMIKMSAECKTAKAEAIKECLQEVRKRTSSYICAARIRWVTDEIEKEMVGDV